MTPTATRAAACVAALLTAASLAACSSDSDTDSDTDQVSVLLDWNPNPDHLAIYTADQIGAYENHGVDPEFIIPGTTADAAKQVSLGQADLAISYETDTILAAAQGLDVVNVGALIPTALNSLIAKKSSGITSAKDLEGKTVAGSGVPSQEPSMRYIAEQAGIDPESITMPNVQQNLNQALLSDQVDAIFGAYPNIEGVELAEQTDIITLSAQELGLPESAELVIIANPTRLAEDAAYADRVRAFLAGTAEGQDAALADTQVAVDALTPVTKGSYDPDLLVKMVDATITILQKGGVNATGDGEAFGVQDAADWAEYAGWMRDNGLLEGADNEDIDGASATTNDYLPE
ncbi:ABC transporter substrate-binding protein [Corynebacterium terpenotabidum]|uniref:ABC transporter substrate-binding protein n=1 Tax=Corynebacterium terpenotabidum Y-11 TaxID=1200352 RepID=S4XBZ1_9CORY|nr:ABC transporter substrate-binding protein [Corynebacterium terpenotabidum]AGP29964.1 ABC transporter substrate-binding protein [Corynebacterium terpenotabidum Y-11]